jgi:transposase-like protein
MNKTIKSIPVTEGARRATGVDGMDFPSKISSATESVVNLPDPEVSQIAKRRRFSADYKLNILRQADTCSQSGDIAALLRSEGLYASHLSTWRRQREAGSLQALKPKTRGRKPAHKIRLPLKMRASKGKSNVSNCASRRPKSSSMSKKKSRRYWGSRSTLRKRATTNDDQHSNFGKRCWHPACLQSLGRRTRGVLPSLQTLAFSQEESEASSRTTKGFA